MVDLLGEINFDPGSTPDILKDSVSTIFTKLMYKGYKGKPPAGGYEVPANMALGKATEEKADYIVSTNFVSEGMDLAFDHTLVPPVHRPDPVAKQSDSPFRHPFQDNAPVGLFGKALQAHSKLISLMKGLGKDTTEFDVAFKVQWGIGLEEDLSEFYSKPRSHGSAIWGGVGKKTVPSVLSLTGSQVQVNIIDKQASKLSVGEDALVNWPRMKAIAMATGVQLVADDKFVADNLRGKNFELPYMLARGEIARAPKKVGIPRFKNIIPEEVAMIRVSLQQVAKHMRKLVSVQVKKHDRLEAEGIFPETVTSAVNLIGHGDEPTGGEVIPMDIFDGDIDFEGVHSIGKKLDFDTKEAIKKLRPVDIIKAAAMFFVDRKHGGVPSHSEVRNWITGLDSNYGLNFDRMYKTVTAVVPADILMRTYRIGNLVAKGVGLVWVNQLRQYLGMKHSAFTERDLEVSWVENLKNRNVLTRVIEEIANGFKEREYVRTSSPLAKQVVLDKLLHPISVTAGLSDLIHIHAIYWHRRYLAKIGKELPKGKITKRQVAAKVMRFVRFRYTEDHEFVVQPESIIPVISESYKNYLNKRMLKKQLKKSLELPEFDGYNVVKYCRDLDAQLGREFVKAPKVTFEDIGEFVMNEIRKFEMDFANIIAKVVKNEEVQVDIKYGKTEVEDDVYPRIQVQDANVNETDATGVDKFFEELDAKESKQEQENMDDLFDDFSGKAEVVLQSGLVDLKSELDDAGVDTNHPIAKLVLSRHPRQVHYKAVEEIRKEVLLELAQMRA